jgi:hypothetical protein
MSAPIHAIDSKSLSRSSSASQCHAATPFAPFSFAIHSNIQIQWQIYNNTLQGSLGIICLKQALFRVFYNAHKITAENILTMVWSKPWKDSIHTPNSATVLRICGLLYGTYWKKNQTNLATYRTLEEHVTYALIQSTEHTLCSPIPPPFSFDYVYRWVYITCIHKSSNTEMVQIQVTKNKKKTNGCTTVNRPHHNYQWPKSFAVTGEEEH